MKGFNRKTEENNKPVFDKKKEPKKAEKLGYFAARKKAKEEKKRAEEEARRKEVIEIIKWMPSFFCAILMIGGGIAAIPFGLAALLSLPLPQVKELKQKINIGPMAGLILAAGLFITGCVLMPNETEPGKETLPVVTEAVTETEMETQEETSVPVTEMSTEAVTTEAETEETTTEAVTEAPTKPKPAYTFDELKATMYANQSVNVRDLPGKDGNKVGSLASGQAVTVTGQCKETGWYRITFSGGTAYVSDSLLTSEKPVVEEKPAEQPPKDTPKQTEAPAVAEPEPAPPTSSGTCWKSETGSKYHSINNCGRMNPNKATQITIEEAERQGLERCTKCY